jgi:hypothetical protein
MQCSISVGQTINLLVRALAKTCISTTILFALNNISFDLYMRDALGFNKERAPRPRQTRASLAWSCEPYAAETAASATGLTRIAQDPAQRPRERHRWLDLQIDADKMDYFGE